MIQRGPSAMDIRLDLAERNLKPFGDFLMPSVRTTQTRLKDFDLDALSPQKSAAINAITKGLLEGGDFLLED